MIVASPHVSFSKSRLAFRGRPLLTHTQGRSPVDQLGEELQATIRDLISDSQDTEVQEALRQSIRAFQDDQRPSTGVVVNQVDQLLTWSAAIPRPQKPTIRWLGQELITRPPLVHTWKSRRMAVPRSHHSVWE